MLKLLIVKTSSMGDVIHNLPIIHDIHQHYPKSQIDWVVESAFQDIPRLHQDVRQVYTVALREWRTSLLSRKTRQAIQASQEQIRAESYDIILDTQGLLKSAWISTWANGVRHGYDWQSAREPLASLLYQHTHRVSKAQHAVTRNRALAALSLGYKIPTYPANFGLSHQTKRQPYVLAFHATSRANKLWATENWIALCHQLAEHGLRILLPWSSENEYQRALQIVQACQNAELLARTSLQKLSIYIQQASVAIGVDTGLSHLAVALGTPTIGIYTDTLPSMTGLYTEQNPLAINLGLPDQPPKVSEVMLHVTNLLHLSR